MNRPIKFMAGYKSKLYTVRSLDIERKVVHFGYGSESHVRDFHEITLHEFTGLHDKDGKEIYEGHKVGVPYVTPMGKVTEEFDSKEVIGFEFGRFVLLGRAEPHALVHWCESTQGEYIPNYGTPTIFANKTALKIIGHIAEEGEI